MTKGKEMIYLGNCTQEDIIEHFFGDVSSFAKAVEDNGDDFTINDLVIKYNNLEDIHYFYYNN